MPSVVRDAQPRTVGSHGGTPSNNTKCYNVYQSDTKIQQSEYIKVPSLPYFSPGGHKTCAASYSLLTSRKAMDSVPECRIPNVALYCDRPEHRACREHTSVANIPATTCQTWAPVTQRYHTCWFHITPGCMQNVGR